MTQLTWSKNVSIDVPLDKLHIAHPVFSMYDGTHGYPFSGDTIDAVFSRYLYVMHSQQMSGIIPIQKQYAVRPGEYSKVYVGYSAGLDSSYAALKLREMGMDVSLVYFDGINKYEGSLPRITAERFAHDTSMELIIVKVYKQQINGALPENPMKNQLIESVLADFCIEKGANNICIGDDKSDDDPKKIKLGINFTDLKQFSDLFEEWLCQNVVGLHIVNPLGNTPKVERLKYLYDNGVGELFYSCVGPSRFLKYHREQDEKTYGVKLATNNCGHWCQKCALYNLMLHYSGRMKHTEAFICACWDRLTNSKYATDEFRFNPLTSLDQRLSELMNY